MVFAQYNNSFVWSFLHVTKELLSTEPMTLNAQYVCMHTINWYYLASFVFILAHIFVCIIHASSGCKKSSCVSRWNAERAAPDMWYAPLQPYITVTPSWSKQHTLLFLSLLFQDVMHKNICRPTDRVCRFYPKPFMLLLLLPFLFLL